MNITFLQYASAFFVSYVAVYSMNVFGFAEVVGSGASALLKAILLSLLLAAALYFTDKPILNLVRRSYGKNRDGQKRQ